MAQKANVKKKIDNSMDDNFKKIDEYQAQFSNPYCAAERGYVDAIIQPRYTRQRLCEALELMSTKRESRPAKKHGNIPV